MTEPYVSQITMFGCNFAIRGWAFCAGQIMPIAQNTALFSLLGTNYGGDGRTTYALPDFRGRAPMQQGQGPGLPNYRLGARGGTEQSTLTVNNLPSHHHQVSISTSTLPTTVAMPTSAGGPDTNDPDDAYFGEFPPDQNIYASALTQPAGQMGGIDVPPLPVSVDGQTYNQGGNLPVQTQSPYLAVTMQISLYGVYPSRN